MSILHFIKKIKTILIIFISWAIYLLSFFMPRNKRIWVFIGWHKNIEREIFSDNSKYFFLHVANTKQNIRAIWIAKDDFMRDILRKNGYESYNIHSILGAYYSLRAGYTIIDALMQLQNWRYSGRSKVIQLWHGDGIKKLKRDSRWSFRKFNKIILYPNLFKKMHFFIASSKYIAENFICPSFGVKKERVLITGLPRYDIFFKQLKGSEIDKNTELENRIKKIKLKNPKKIILYAPTFRRNNIPPLSHIKLNEFNNFLRAKNYFVMISLHPKFSTKEWIPENIFSNIFFINPDFDRYPFLPYFDAVITDYSSICLEFLLLRKPTIFFVYDFEEYKKNPGLIENFWNLIPGIRVEKFDQLLEAIKKEDDDFSKKQRQDIRNKLFTFPMGNSSELLLNELLNEIDR